MPVQSPPICRSRVVTERLGRDDIQALLDSSPFIVFCGMTCEKVWPDEDKLSIRMPMRPELERFPNTGQFHGGPIASLIDDAGDFAIALSLGGAVPTVNLRTDYLRPATGESLLATAQVRRLGRTVAVIDVDVHDAQGRLVAIGRGTYSSTVG